MQAQLDLAAIPILLWDGRWYDFTEPNCEKDFLFWNYTSQSIAHKDLTRGRWW